MTKKKVIKIVAWTLAIIVSCILVFPLPFLGIGYLVYSKNYNSSSHIKYNPKKLKKDAHIVSSQTKVCGLKFEHKFRTTVIFSDGFTYISHATNRTDSWLSYEISISASMKENIIDRAISAHYEALGIPRPPKPQQFTCGKCGHEYEGVSTDNCPKCQSSIKYYKNH